MEDAHGQDKKRCALHPLSLDKFSKERRNV